MHIFPDTSDSTVQELIRTLTKSEKFRTWNPEPDGPIHPQNLAQDLEQSCILALEKHYTAREVAKVWGVSVDLVRSLFRDEPDVLALDRTKRGKYITLRIPESVMIRVHRRLSQG
jgi:hypothetical protein